MKEISGKRGHTGRMNKLTLKEKAARAQRAMKRERERKLRKKYKIPSDEPVNRKTIGK